LSKQGQMDFDEIQDVQEVIIRTAEKEIVINAPQVTKMIIPGQGEIFQVVGQGIDQERAANTEVEKQETEPEIEVTPEDAQLVAQQAGVSIEEGMAALKQSGGDLAKAILMLKQMRP
ncbi:MAG: NAC domain-containing protein, partial [Candidatus Helarchaeota archaeon]